MKESAHVAYIYLKANAEKFGVPENVFKNWDVHLHIPAGAIPKDGPSAGTAILTALASTFSQRLIKSKLAMTGEITLRGLVLPIGGVKEKTLAAMRAGIKTVILPEQNRKDLPEVAEEAQKKLKFIFVKNVAEVLDAAIERPKTKR